MAICAYCDKDRKPTGEHLIPAWMYKAVPELTMRYLGKIDKCVNAEFEINDVCDQCNRKRLGDLDAYVKTLWERYFSTYVRDGEIVEFEYDYNLLSRWLLKVFYNHARAANDADRGALSRLAPYMLGEAGLPTGMAIALRLIIPYKISNEDARRLSQPEREILVEGGIPPSLVRIDHVDPSLKVPGISICRRIMVMSYDFHVLVPESVEAKIEMSRQMEEARYLQTKEGAVFLYPKYSVVRVPASRTTSFDIMKRFVGKHPDLQPAPRDNSKKRQKNG